MRIDRWFSFLAATSVLLLFAFSSYGEEKPFITRWQGEAGKELVIPIIGKGYKLVIKKADATVLLTEPSVTVDIDTPYKYTPTEDGELLVEAGPENVEFIRTYYDGGGICEKTLLKVEQFGSVKWTTMNHAFAYCEKMQFAETIDAPDLSKVTDMSYMFAQCWEFNRPLEHWDVSNVTNMTCMLEGMNHFNQPLNNWKVSNVTDMSCMFYYSSAFNQPLDRWDVSNVTRMERMFADSRAFNQNLGTWKLNKCSQLGLQKCGMSVENYSNSLKGWAEQKDINENLILEVEPLHFNEEAKSARTKLVNKKHWAILGDVTDGGTLYSLGVGSVQLSSDNITSFQEALTNAGVLKKGKVSVELVDNKPVLKLDNAELVEPNKTFNTFMLKNERDEVTIQLQGVCSIEGLYYNCPIAVEKGVFAGRNADDKLLVKKGFVFLTSSIRNCAIEIDGNLAGNSKELEIDNAIVKAGTIQQYKSLTLKNCSILQPEGAYFDADKKCVIDKDGVLAENVVIGSRASGVTLPATQTVAKDSQYTLKATVLPENTVNKRLVWSSNNSEIASVDQSGLVTAKAGGKAKITVETEDGGFRATCEVEVAPPAAVEDTALASLSVAPNPFTTQVWIENPEGVAVRYELVNASGIVVRSEAFAATEVIVDTEALPAGLYFVRIEAKNGAKRVVKALRARRPW